MPSTQTKPVPTLTHLQRLGPKASHHARGRRGSDPPVMLYSIGKDSSVMPTWHESILSGAAPFPLLHVDNTWKFREMYVMRERAARDAGMELIVYQNPEQRFKTLIRSTMVLRCIPTCGKPRGSGRRWTSMATTPRSEERGVTRRNLALRSGYFLSHCRPPLGPKKPASRLWRLYNMRKKKGESIRVFPISNWTELDVWLYIYHENIPIVPLYRAAEREVVDRDGTLVMVDDDRMRLRPGESR